MSTPAPQPGVGAQADAREAAARILRLRLRDDTFTVAANNIGVRVKDRFMGETGHALEWYLAPERVSSGDVAVCALWFVARLLRGDAVTWDQILDEYEAAEFKSEDIEVIEDDGKGDDPEA